MRCALIFACTLLIRHGAAAFSDTVKLNNGVDMPTLAFAAQLWDAPTCQNATTLALEAGFRNIWSSMLVGDDCQKAQSLAIKTSSVPLGEIFVGGTVNTQACSSKEECYQQTKSGANSQLQILGKTPLDMLMLDYPSSATGCDGILGQWQAFEEIYSAKHVRTIAVSNFNMEQLKCITANASLTVPSVNQVQYSVGHGHDTVVADDGSLGIYVQAYSPLGSGSVLSEPPVLRIGKAHNRSSAAVALRWIIQRNVSIATQSTKLDHLKEDASIFDFTLTQKEMEELNALTREVFLFF